MADGEYEFEDVVSEVEDADVLAPPPPVLHRARRPAKAGFRKARVPGLPPVDRMAPVRIERDSTSSFAVFHWPSCALHLDSLRHWREHCRKGGA